MPTEKMHHHRSHTEIEYVLRGDNAPSTNKGNTISWSASATTASSMAARKREPGEMVMVS